MIQPRLALICSISGQDIAYLAQLRLQNDYRAIGASRDAQRSKFGNLTKVGIRNQIDVASMALSDFRRVLQVLAKC